jgi:Ser/Thr protein kinase RdoA (MazF antagonist)
MADGWGDRSNRFSMGLMENIFRNYGLVATADIKPFGNGLINSTWKVCNSKEEFILQRINNAVFKNPNDIAHNIQLIGSHLSIFHPDYLFVAPVKTLQQQDILFIDGEGYFRLFPFIKNSHTIDVASSPSQAYEAAKQFGLFTKQLSNFPSEQLHITLPGFHNLSLRYQQFEKAVIAGNAARIKEAENTIQFLKANNSIVAISEQLKKNTAFKKRVTHHDTKISNVLFDDNKKGLCVIDLDTVMPGYFISDIGDMLRTYLSPVSEEEKAFDTIEIRTAYFKAVADGYLEAMSDELSEEEKQHFMYAGKFATYMQAIRFLTDYLNNDVYYGSKYEGHNFIRTKNQVVLLQKMMEKEKELQKIIGC